MNRSEKYERITRAPADAKTRLVLSIILDHVVDGWCVLPRAEIASLAGLNVRTLTRVLAALVPDHLERIVQKPGPTAYSPSQRATAVSRSTGHPQPVQRDTAVSRSHIGTYKGGDSRVANAAELTRLLEGRNVVPIGGRKKRPATGGVSE
jgi:hypothetical protein